MGRLDASGAGGSERLHSRRDVLKLGTAIAAGSLVAPLLAACSPGGRTGTPGGPAGGAAEPGALSGRITVLTTSGGPMAQPALRKVYDDFKVANPGVEWDIRALAPGAEWDRLARAALSAGEPVGLVTINGLFVRAWARDGLLRDLRAEPALRDVLARVPQQFRFVVPGDAATRAFPLAVTNGVHTTGIFYNKALLDRAGLEAPGSLSDLKAMVAPLSALGAAPLVFCSGDLIFNAMLVMWLLPMIVGGSGDPLEFVERTVRGDLRYDAPEWIEALETIEDLRDSGVLLEGSGAADYGTMQQLLLQGRAAMAYNGSWMLSQLLAATPAGEFDLHVAPLPRVAGADRPRPLLAWDGFALPAAQADGREAVAAFLEYASRSAIDRAVTAATQSYSPMPTSNGEIENVVAREFVPLFDDAITPLNWLWEPEIEAEINNQVQALVKGDTDAASAARAVQDVAEALRSSGRSFYS